ncbi:MAG: biotin--[acetyl-CoA-carboxylase] ligase [Candidatus Rhabdochlamydia sp.]
MIIDYIHLESVGSTNSFAKENAHHFHPDHLTCIIAKEQTAGRGRHDRKWISSQGKGLYLSVFVKLPSYLSYLPNLGQIMALSCHQILLLQEVILALKWPNDLIIDNRKIGGVLTETLLLDQGVGVVIGIGLNVNLSPEDYAQIDQPVTSLCEWIKTPLAPVDLIDPLMKQFSSNLVNLREQGFSFFHAYFEKHLAYRGKIITIKLPQEKLEGICHALLPDGSLSLLLPSGYYRSLSIGEIVMPPSL